MFEKHKTCAFSGHRPEKLAWGEREEDPRCAALKTKLCKEVKEAYAQGFTHFLCGMSRGCDMYFFEAVSSLRDKAPQVTLEAVIPCEGQSRFWKNDDRERYSRLLSACDKVTLLQRRYTAGCMKRRNEYMVDHSALLITVFDGSGGGTAHTIRYAESRGVEINKLWL